MERLLQQLWDRFLRVGEMVVDALESEVHYQKFQDQIKAELDGTGRDIMQSVIEAADERLRAKPAERVGWVVAQRNHEKELLTPFGPMRYSRTYFKHKETKQHRYLTDDAMGFTAHQRIDTGLKAELIERSTELSFQRSGQWSRHGSWHVSGQAVMKATRTLDVKREGAQQPLKGKRRLPYLFIQADEDHVGNQDGPRFEPRLVTVHEGVEGPENRRRLVNPKRFGGHYTRMNAAQLYEEVWKYLDSEYDLEHVSAILVCGDGASWIRALCEFIPGARFVLDRYHAQKYVRAATGANHELYSQLWRALVDANRPRMREVLDDALNRAETSTQRERIDDARRYFESRWKGVQAWQTFENVWPGCSAEGDVSHVLAARMSSRPMAWRAVGVDQMSRMRVKRANGESMRQTYLEQYASGLQPVRIARDELRRARAAFSVQRDLGYVVQGMLPALGKARSSLHRTLRSIANG